MPDVAARRSCADRRVVPSRCNGSDWSRRRRLMSLGLRVLVPSASALLTDHRPHGEGLIAWDVFSGLAARGHELVVCAREAALRSSPPFEVVETGRASRWESVEPLA